MLRLCFIILALIGGSLPAHAQMSSDVLRYSREVAQHIEQYKAYPLKAERQHRGGRVVVRFSVNAQGRLLDAKIRESSCQPDFDRAALATLHRAEPLPQFPPSITKSQLSFTLPLIFAMRPGNSYAIPRGGDCRPMS